MSERRRIRRIDSTITSGVPVRYVRHITGTSASRDRDVIAYRLDSGEIIEAAVPAYRDYAPGIEIPRAK